MKAETSIARTTYPNTVAGSLRTACAARLLPLLLLLTLPAAVQAQFNYTTNNGAITITGYTGSGGAVSIPSSTNGLPVTSIGSSAFYLCVSLTSVTIPNSVTSIGDDAFEFCVSLTSVTIPNSVTSIGDDAFFDCLSLTNVMISKSVTSIDTWAFGQCTSLTAITVDASNSVYSSVDGVLFNKIMNTLIQCPGGKTGSYTVPNNVTSIGDNAFYGCTSLTNIVIGNSVTSIGSSAFSSCYSLTSVTIPNSVTNIGDDAFEFCTSLTSVTIPDSVTSIGDHAFAFCTSLTSVTIGTNVTSVGSFAFSSCTNLTSVTIGNSVTSIGSFAFYNCTHLTGVYFQGNAPGLGSFVFDGDNPTVYYLPGTTGWENFAQLTGLPTVLWKPQVQTGDASFGVRTNRFGFNINWASGMVVLVEVCTNLAHPIWSPVGTNTLTGGSSYFSDSHWTNYPARFYRASATITNTAPTGGTTLRVLPGYTLSAYIDTNTGENHVNPQTLMAAGGSPFAGYTWSTSGFPMGTTVAPLTGVFSSNGGTIIAGHYPFTVSVSDGTSTATGSVTLNVTTTTPIPFAILQQYPSGSFALDDANANKPYGASLFAMGGTPPYSWSEDASYSERGDFDLSGLTIGQSSGIVRGTLFNSSSGKTLKFRVIVRDNAGDTSSGPVYTITVR